MKFSYLMAEGKKHLFINFDFFRILSLICVFCSVQLLSLALIQECLYTVGSVKINTMKTIFPFKIWFQTSYFCITKELIFCHKLKSSYPNIFATWWCKSLIFQTWITLSISLRHWQRLENQSLWQRLNSFLHYFLLRL